MDASDNPFCPYVENGEALHIPYDILLGYDDTKETRRQAMNYLADCIQRFQLRPKNIETDVEKAAAAFEDLASTPAALVPPSMSHTGKFEETPVENCLGELCRKKVGMNASHEFHKQDRWSTYDYNSNAGPYTAWTYLMQHGSKGPHVAKLGSIFKFTQFTPYRPTHVTNGVLFRCVQQRCGTAGQFRPYAALCIYDYFRPKRVLDPCAGWGDRLAAACASPHVEHYCGIEPRESAHAKYQEQIKLYGGSTTTRFLASAVEDVTEDVGQYDLAFTSPPYFNREKYADHGTKMQSWVRYKKYDEWFASFAKPLLRFMATHSKLVAININDFITYGEKTHFCQDVLEFMKSEGHAYLGYFAYTINKKPGRQHLHVLNMEPIYVFSTQEIRV